MVKCTIKIDTVLDAKKFVGLCNTVPYDVDLVSGRYVIDAKSIMGIFSLDLSKPIELQIECSQEDPFLCKLEPYIVP